MPLKRPFGPWLGALTLSCLLGCGSNAVIDPSDGRATPRFGGQTLEGPLADRIAKGLTFSLSQGSAESAPLTRPSAASPLSEALTSALLKRLPPIQDEQGDRVGFALREGSKPPPLTGKDIQATFPPPDKPQVGPDATRAEPLEVLRFQPTGEVPLAPRISVTFNNPMVAVTSHDALAAEAVPVKVAPPVEGVWRWVGTKTLFFEPTGRAPMATDYEVSVPAGVKDALGQSLATSKSWSFSTPPPSIKSSRPGGTSVALEPTYVIHFDQRVDTAEILQRVTVSAGSQRFETRPLTAEETKELHEPGNKDLQGRWVAFKTVGKLPTDTRVRVQLPVGTPSAEGPRKTSAPLSYDFKTYGPFQVEEHKCGWRECRPGQRWSIRFSNALDEDHFDPQMVTVTPKVEGLEADISHRNLYLRGLTRGRTKYTVTLSPKLKDTFGQELGDSPPLTFEVGEAEALMGTPHAGMVVLDPSGKARRLPVYTVNYDQIEVALYKVAPSDHDAYLDYRRRWRRDDGPKSPPGQKVFDERIKTGAEPDALTEVAIDLSPALDGGLGHVVVVARPVGAKDRWAMERHTVIAWVQSTQIALDAFVDANDLVGWATSLADGSPLSNLELVLAPGAAKATTGAGGLAAIPLPGSATAAKMLVARSGKDVAFLTASDSYYSSSGWARRTERDALRWMVFDDRKLYRPAETVSVKGFVRLFEAGEKGDINTVPNGTLRQLSYRVLGSRGNELAKGTTQVNAAGGFHMAFKLPKTPNLGRARIEFKSGVSKGRFNNVDYNHYFDIQEFRRPEFEVTSSASAGPHLVGGSGTMTVKASYFAGGPLPNTEVEWRVRSSAGSFSPPNHPDFVFGTWVPWWKRPGPKGIHKTQSISGRTDASGSHTIKVDFESIDPPRAMTVTGDATVSDVNRQTWTASTSLLVHPAEHYVGLKTDKRFVDKGADIKVDMVVADLDGKRVVGSPIKVEMVRLAWKRVKKRWTMIEVDPQTCQRQSAADPTRCTLTPKAGGQHRIRATIRDKAQRRNQSTLTVWVAGGERPPNRKLEQEAVELIPERRDYAPGETARILVQAPFSPADGVMSIRRSGLVETVPFRMDKASHTLEVKVEEWMIPNFHVHVNLNGSAPRTDAAGNEDPKLPRRPAYARGTIGLRVPPKLRTLKVTAVPASAKLAPGEETTLALAVSDSDGRPVAGAELAVIVVDEAVLALTGYRIPDPVTLFYSSRGPQTRDRHLRERVLLASVDDLLAAAEKAAQEMEDGRVEDSMALPAPSAGAAPPRKRTKMAEMRKSSSAQKNGGKAADAPISVRKNFDALALFAPEVPTGADGQASVAITLPDNLTRYRVMVIAVEGRNRFGSAEAAITARLPLMVRVSAPRFLNFGDRFELPVVVQNQTDDPQDVHIAVRATNAQLTAGQGRAITVGANDRVEVRFSAAAQMAGTARFQAGAAAGAFADAAEVALPVWTPATTEAFATYGTIDKGGTVQPVMTPPDVVKVFGGLDVTTSATQLQALTDAVLYLTSYPFECSEQLASRVMSIAALKDVLGAFKTEGLPSPEALLKAVERDLKRLQGMQNSDGGFAFWRRGRPSWPFNTLHVSHALARAKAKGFQVPQQMIDRSMGYLRDVQAHIPSTYGPSIRRVIRAYALYVRLQHGERDADEARKVIAEAGLDALSLETVGWLYPVLSGAEGSDRDLKAIRKLLNNRITETAGLAHFVTSYSDGAHLILHSARRVDGLLLEGLIGDQPDSDLIVKLVRGLMGHRKKGRWGSTQENAWVLLGLDRYFNTYEKVTPDFVARVWLGDGFAGEHAFKGRTTERHHIHIPMQTLAQTEGAQPLTIAKKGAGRLYYRVGMRYAPASLKLDPADHGFTVERVYEAIDDPAEVTRDDEGRWVVKAGAKVRVRVTMVAPERRYHVALVDPLPAGFEALNPALRGTENVPPASGGPSRPGRRTHWMSWGPWYEHTNLRDERAEAFRALLWAGVYTYEYIARATTPGTFVVPPPKAEEMYQPETFGRGASDVVIVK